MSSQKLKGSSTYIVNLSKAVGISILLTLSLMIIQTLIMSYTNLSENMVPVTNSIIMIISIAVGAIYISIKIKQKGWLNGGIIGILYIVILVLLNILFIDAFTFNKYLVLKTVIGLVTGSVGGIIGVNIK